VFEQLLDGLCVDVQAVAQAAAPPYPLSKFFNVKDHELQSLPPSQDYLTPPDSVQLSNAYPQIQLHFAEAEAVKLMLLGLRDSDVMGCISHGVENNSSSTSQPNPVDAVMRMAAHMSGADFAKASQDVQNYRKTYALSLMFLELDELLAIVSCPKSASAKVDDEFDSGSVVTDKDILSCIEAGKACGAIEGMRCPLDLPLVFARANRKFVDMKKGQFRDVVKSFAAAYFSHSKDPDASAAVVSSGEDFLRWLMERREPHLVCRVEGADDALLLDALLDWSRHTARAPPTAWNDFSFVSRSDASRATVQIRLCNVPQVDLSCRTGVYSFPLDGSIHTWNDSFAFLSRKMFSRVSENKWIDVSDGDLKAPVCVPAPGSQHSSHVMLRRWCSRGIENMLLHPTCALWFLQNDFEVASSAFREVFHTMSKNFFGSAGCSPHTIVSSAKKCGDGWMDWHRISFEESKLEQHRDMTEFLARVIAAMLGPGNVVGSAALVLFEFFGEADLVPEVEKEQKRVVKLLLPKYARVCDLVLKGNPDADSFPQQLQQIVSASSSRKEAMWGMEKALLDNDQASVILCKRQGPQKQQSEVPKDAKSAFWERNRPSAALDFPGPAYFAYAFPRFLSFLYSLCLADEVPASIKAAAESCVCAAFRVLCAAPFALDDDAYVQRLGLNSLLFRSRTATQCSGFVPRSSNDGACLRCQQPQSDHVLAHNGRGSADDELQFMRVACRVGCMGWASHPLMVLVHGTTHLGVSFDERSVSQAQASYRLHLHHHALGPHPSLSDAAPCEHCAGKSLAIESLPRVVRDEVQKMLQERALEFQSLIDAIDAHCGPRTPTAPADASHAAQGDSQQQQRSAPDIPSSSSPPAPSLHALVASSGSPPADAAAARSVVAQPSADGASEHPEADHLALKLREIKISDDATVLADMSAKLRRDGIFGMEDLQGLSLDEVKEAVAALNLNAVQLRRLFAAVPNIRTSPQ